MPETTLSLELTNEEVTSICDHTTDEDVHVAIPVKTLRRLLEDSEKWKQANAAISGASWADYPDRSGGQFTDQEIKEANTWR